jgi:hypothetical protein
MQRSGYIRFVHHGPLSRCRARGGGILATFKTQHEAIDWARKQGHAPLVARVRHLNDKKKPDRWRAG